MAILLSKTIAVYDDSFQPTGEVHWQGLDPHIEMKKLRHELTLTIEGPNDEMAAAIGCLKEAGIAAALSTVVAAFSGVGIGGTSAAWGIFQAAFLKCAGEKIQTRLDDKSIWIKWDM